MTTASQAAFYQHPYAQTLEATVLAVDADRVMLDQTLFYPEGGGQPGDQGTWTTPDGAQQKVIDTRKGELNGEIWHQLADDQHGLKVDDVIQQQLDWPRRHRLMRMHTALHLLCSLVPRGVTGGSVGEEKSRLDFDLGDATVDKVELTEALNKLVQQAIPVSSEWITDAELDANPELVRTMSVQPPRGAGQIRMLRVEGVDYQPCGGTHVANTAEIGPVSIRKIENKGKRNRRIHLILND
ncbi:alanyl-tRNA editing protein [Aestuariirhabdus sp. Z084]|uniref:alanyl-tRNA editing protein n=1 Tax=Aestuariirhabdus haliotis TaxID=2918751 RepID=UPI00201B3648|nr:alanyl-tRNA editing protein [Aestuariirhabdus haliotis]MCL6417723.1 alanyl-tRNA editing protein [Aestuariirhabdus haliotis]MCL6421672.1 alanyl-tRNA editing protein [Aestuariirhabdus haliotis]